MDPLKRDLAPLTDEAWNEIEDEIRRTLVAHLVARRVVDVEGPHGWDFSAVDLGRLDLPGKTKKPAGDGVGFGIRRLQPLVESRREFELDIWELDDVSRGARDADVDAAVQAAREIAEFENRTVVDGLEAAGVRGLSGASSHPAITVTEDAASCLDGLSRGLMLFQEAGIEGPCSLLAGPRVYRALASGNVGYPPLQQARQLLGGDLVYGAVVDGAVLVSRRGGDLELTLGQDVSLGYQRHDAERVRLYLTETFTFRALTPEAIIRLEMNTR